jgi:hypothetical protein
MPVKNLVNGLMFWPWLVSLLVSCGGNEAKPQEFPGFGELSLVFFVLASYGVNAANPQGLPGSVFFVSLFGYFPKPS